MGSVMVSMILGLFAIFFSCGVYMVAAERLGLPTFKSSLAVLSVGRFERKKRKGKEVFVLELSARVSRFIRLDEFRKKKLAATLKSAGINISPETYIAKAWIKAGLVLPGVIPALIIFPGLSFVILLLSVMVYFKEIRSADAAVKKKKEAIEAELFRFVMTLEQELKTSRDILRMLETYRKNAGQVFRNELDITIADMKSGSMEAALSRFEARIGSAMLSDAVRGLLSVIRGDDGRVYFQMLAHDFKLIEVQKLKLIAMKRPSKVRKYSFFMLGCFIAMYLAVIAVEILKAFSTMF